MAPSGIPSELRGQGLHIFRSSSVPPTMQGKKTRLPRSPELHPACFATPATRGRQSAGLRPAEPRGPLTCRAPGPEGGKSRPSPPSHVPAPPPPARDLVPKGHESAAARPAPPREPRLGWTPGGGGFLAPWGPASRPGDQTRSQHFCILLSHRLQSGG